MYFISKLGNATGFRKKVFFFLNFLYLPTDSAKMVGERSGNPSINQGSTYLRNKSNPHKILKWKFNIELFLLPNISKKMIISERLYTKKNSGLILQLLAWMGGRATPKGQVDVIPKMKYDIWNWNFLEMLLGKLPIKWLPTSQGCVIDGVQSHSCKRTYQELAMSDFIKVKWLIVIEAYLHLEHSYFLTL